MQSCIFCRIIRRELPSEIVFEDDKVVAFKDIRPVAPVHVLVCPKKHIPTLNDITSEDGPLIAHIVSVATKLAAQFGIHQKGYRTIFNVNPEAGQTIYHIHLHVIGGRRQSWP
jgi:histidine triad (HIT) family protein